MYWIPGFSERWLLPTDDAIYRPLQKGVRNLSGIGETIGSTNEHVFCLPIPVAEYHVVSLGPVHFEPTTVEKEVTYNHKSDL